MSLQTELGVCWPCGGVCTGWGMLCVAHWLVHLRSVMYEPVVCSQTVDGGHVACSQSEDMWHALRRWMVGMWHALKQCSSGGFHLSPQSVAH